MLSRSDAPTPNKKHGTHVVGVFMARALREPWSRRYLEATLQNQKTEQQLAGVFTARSLREPWARRYLETCRQS